MIPILTDATTLDTDCIGLADHKRKSTRNQRKRSIQPLKPTSGPKRKKRKPNKSHRNAFPDLTDAQIRKRLDKERKAKNRKSARESRERRKEQEAYLEDRLPKGIAFKELLKKTVSAGDHYDDCENERLQYALKKDEELSQMQMILDTMADHSATQYDEHSHIIENKSSVMDALLTEILTEYLTSSTHTDSDSDSDCDSDIDFIETDHDPMFIRIINEIQNGGAASGCPMDTDDDTKSVVLSTKSVPLKQGRIKRDSTLHDGFDAKSIDHDIASESAVSIYPVPQDTMLNQCKTHQQVTSAIAVESQQQQQQQQLRPIPSHLQNRNKTCTNSNSRSGRNGRNSKNGKGLNDIKNGERVNHNTAMIGDIIQTVLAMLGIRLLMRDIIMKTETPNQPMQPMHYTSMMMRPSQLKEILRHLKETLDWNQDGKDRKMKVWIEQLQQIQQSGACCRYPACRRITEKVQEMEQRINGRIRVNAETMNGIMDSVLKTQKKIMSSGWKWKDCQDYAAHKQCLEQSQMNRINDSHIPFNKINVISK